MVLYLLPPPPSPFLYQEVDIVREELQQLVSLSTWHNLIQVQLLAIGILALFISIPVPVRAGIEECAQIKEVLVCNPEERKAAGCSWKGEVSTHCREVQDDISFGVELITTEWCYGR